MAVLGITFVDGRLAVSKLPNTADILLSIATTHIVPHVVPVVSHWFRSPEHL